MIKAPHLLHHFKLKALLFFALLGCGSLRAQYVTLPDSAFVNWLQAAGFAGCFHNGQFDTTCTSLQSINYINISNVSIANLEGIQYFKNLDSLKCNTDTVLARIPVLPNSVKVLECRNNILTSLPKLPDSLQRLACEFNLLGSLPALPAMLTSITCYNNNLDSLPALPVGLVSLFCSGNQITTLPALPSTLTVLSCYANKLTTLPALPAVLTTLACAHNHIVTLPALPAALKSLSCYSNGIYSLPTLPDSLQQLSCGYNSITTLPAFPGTLTVINCEHNRLTSLPALPDSLFQLYIDNNPNLTCLPQLNTIVDFEFFTTGVACLPNAGNVYLSNPDTVNVCDSTFNPNGCTIAGIAKETIKPTLVVYPNPAKDNFVVETDANTLGGNIRVVNAVGQIVSFNKIETELTRINTTSMAAGIYMVLVSDTKGHLAISKIVVQ